jgi:multiple sugar transport system permease protein
MHMQTSSALAPPSNASFATRYSRWQRRYAPYLFISPFFILFAIFGLFPTLFSLFVSFQRWDPVSGLGGMKFTGIENYQYILTDTFFWKSLKNTVFIALISGIPQHLIAIPLAFVIHTSLKRVKSVVTAVYFSPYITSTAAIAIVFQTLYSEHNGVLNWALGGLNQVPLLGLLIPDEPIRWLGRSSLIPWSIAVLVIWRYTGWNVVLYLSGLQAIPPELYEAAEVDGASKYQQFRFITLPLLRPIAFFAVTLTIIGNMQLFAEPFLLVNRDGGASNAGLTSVMYLYKTAFTDLDMGLASAISWVLFAFIVILTILNNRLFRSGKAD